MRLDSLILILSIIILACIIHHSHWLCLISHILFCLFFFHLGLIILDSFYERSRLFKCRIWNMELSSMYHLLHLYSLLWNGKYSLCKGLRHTIIINKSIFKKIFRKALNIIHVLKLCLVHSLVACWYVLASLIVRFEF